MLADSQVVARSEDNMVALLSLAHCIEVVLALQIMHYFIAHVKQKGPPVLLKLVGVGHWLVPAYRCVAPKHLLRCVSFHQGEKWTYVVTLRMELLRRKAVPRPSIDEKELKI